MDESAIFSAALEKQEPDERRAFLRAACGEDRTLLARIERLLSAHEHPDTFLVDPVARIINKNTEGELAASELPTLLDKPGAQIGSFKLLEQIGEGGFGVVYLAEQFEPVRRNVALKIVKPGMDSRQVIARFEAEQQALALMDHPGVAKVLDGGVTQTGRPYFVMELVRGIPITNYCDQSNLTTRERLEMFLQVCLAVQHAHQKGIIHRDIKPTNVLVAMQDGTPVPKVIDFGVAKAINQRLTEKTLHTGYTQMLGTPMYMSPEQAEMNPLEVDTRSDIYSLGVLLYELLTGTTPFEKERLSKASFDELRRIIRQEEPPRPSARISTLADHQADTVAHQHRTDPRKLFQTVRGDLDWIVMKCLEKDRTRRYETANGLARDIERHCCGEPIEARPRSAAYMFGKFARRNRVALTTAAAVLLTVAAGVLLSMVLIAGERDAAQAAADDAREQRDLAERNAIQAEKEQKRAEQNLLKAKEAVDTWFTKVAERLDNMPHMTEIRLELLEDALKFYEGFLEQKSDDPEIQRESGLANERVSRIYHKLGRDAHALEPQQRAVAIFEALSNRYPDSVQHRSDLALSYSNLGLRLGFLQRNRESVEPRLKGLEIYKQLATHSPSNIHYRRRVATVSTELAGAMWRIGKPEEGEALYRQSLAEWERFRKDFPDVAPEKFEEAHVHLWLGNDLRSLGRYDEALEHLRRAVELKASKVERRPEDHDQRHLLAEAKFYLGNELLRRGELEQAEAEFRSAVELSDSVVDNFPTISLYRKLLRQSYERLSLALFSQRRLDEAEQAQREVIALESDDPGDDINAVCNQGWWRYNLGLVVHHEGRIQEAADLFREAMERFNREFQPGVRPRRFENALRWTLLTCPLPQFRDPERALKFCNEFLQLEPLSGDHWGCLGIAHYRLGHWDEAIAAIEKVFDLQNGGSSRDFYFLAMAHWQRGDKEDARKWYQRALEYKQNFEGPNSPDLLNFRTEAEALLGINDQQAGDTDRQSEGKP